MTADIIQSLKQKLAQIPQVKYVDENWGQLDYYSQNPPVKFPCILIDVASGKFQNIGREPGNLPVNRQTGEFMVGLTVAYLKLTNSSAQAPAGQQGEALSIHYLIQAIHVEIHGWSPGANIGKFIREGQQREKRDDGIQEHSLFYSVGVSNC